MGGGQSKVYFVDKGGGDGGVKNAQKCVYVFYGCPLRVIIMLEKRAIV